jgi:16S rRNA U516 pseudouridylate synthase RsuA-like enzyme
VDVKPPAQAPEDLDRVVSKAGIGSRTEASVIPASPEGQRKGRAGSRSLLISSATAASTTNRSMRATAPYILLYKPTGYLTTY